MFRGRSPFTGDIDLLVVARARHGDQNAFDDVVRPYDPDPAASTAGPQPGPAAIAVGRNALAAALDRLVPDQRAAGVLGVRAGTIGYRLGRARAALRRAPDGGDEEG